MRCQALTTLFHVFSLFCAIKWIISVIFCFRIDIFNNLPNIFVETHILIIRVDGLTSLLEGNTFLAGP